MRDLSLTFAGEVSGMRALGAGGDGGCEAAEYDCGGEKHGCNIVKYLFLNWIVMGSSWNVG